MAVAKDQIQELLDIIWYEVPAGATARILKRFKGTKAYSKNKSFKDTVDRMIERNSKRRLFDD